MKLLYMDWNSFCRQDVLTAFEHLGHTCVLSQLPEKARMLGLGKQTIDELYQTIRENQPEAVFSMNYFPMVSEACEQAKIPYISWIYDNPYMKGYSINIINSCNYIFTFDSAMYQELSAQGVQTIYYAPLAANPERIAPSEAEPLAFRHDISFVGALYDEDHNFYDEFVKNARQAGKHYYVGYIDALIKAQLQLYGTNLLAASLPAEIAQSGFASINPWTETNSYFTTPENIFADNVLCRRITSLERKRLLEKLSARFSVDLYTRDKKAVAGSCHNHGYADYTKEMPEIFRTSRINLNISLKSIKNGIPLRAMEIMGAGGFLLTNYQPDFLLHFEPGVDFVYYENMEDAVEKAAYYLSHEEERARIAASGLNKIRQYHTYEARLAEMLAVVTGQH
ncbi:MAG: glycosyltransferase [Lachnospiraceae bacterium]|nr:glycosyltransferase [Lachnospiraceae bacterium]